MDFGLAGLAAGSSGLTRTGARMGTPGYMAPEQHLGRGTDARTDLYSLGVVLFEMATGQPPFEGGEDSDYALMKSHVETEPPDVRELNPSFPGELGAVIACCLKKEPAARYTTAEELHAALAEGADSMSRQDSVSVRGFSPASAAQAQVRASSPEPAPAPVTPTAPVVTPKPRPVRVDANESTRQEQMTDTGERRHESVHRMVPSEDFHWTPQQDLRRRAVLLSFVALTIGILVLQDHVQDTNNDRRTCAWAEKADSKRAWTKYLKVFPGGTCAHDAKARLDAIKQDISACQQAKKADSLVAWRTYLVGYEEGACAGEAHTRISALADLQRGSERQKAAQRAAKETAESKKPKTPTSAATSAKAEKVKASQYEKMGDDAFGKGNYAEAKAYFNLSLKYSNRASIHKKIGYCYKNMGKVAEAKASFKRYVSGLSSSKRAIEVEILKGQGLL